MKRTILIAVACACMATPAMADLFNFTYAPLQSTFNGITFHAGVVDTKTTGIVTSLATLVPGSEQALFFPGGWGGNADASFNMDISNVVTGPVSTASGDGGFLLYDTEGDVISGHINGTWTFFPNVPGAIPTFSGALSQVQFSDFGPQDNKFNGSTGFVTMDFPGSPWNGWLIEMTTSGLWFDKTWANPVEGGGVIGQVVPLPGAVLLGLLGLVAAGRKLRKAV